MMLLPYMYTTIIVDQISHGWIYFCQLAIYLLFVENVLFLGGDNEVRHVLIMDEVDGMSGNEDRAGVCFIAELAIFVSLQKKRE